ncbi:MAG: hypothetical protein LBT43_18055 [Prevotella sp.]|nr:hypothetical protein [Prevotella sp.]
MEKERNDKPDGDVNIDFEESVIGKSNFTLSQPVPTTATPMAKEPIIGDNAHTFAAESDPAPMDIDYSLEREPDEDDDIDEEQEAIELEEMFGKNVCYASGVVIDELHKIKHVVESSEASPAERQEAGRILYEQKETEIVEQLSSGKTANIISELIDLHISLHKKETSDETVRPRNVSKSEELENFDVNKFLNKN